MQNSSLQFWSAISGGTAVCILALAAHFLPTYLNDKLVSAVITAGEIQLLHAILCVYLFNEFSNVKLYKLAPRLIFLGSLVFSFSIYILAANSIVKLDFLKVFGPITPVGGIIMVFGWFNLAINYYKLRTKNQ